MLRQYYHHSFFDMPFHHNKNQDNILLMQIFLPQIFKIIIISFVDLVFEELFVCMVKVMLILILNVCFRFIIIIFFVGVAIRL